MAVHGLRRPRLANNNVTLTLAFAFADVPPDLFVLFLTGDGVTAQAFPQAQVAGCRGFRGEIQQQQGTPVPANDNSYSTLCRIRPASPLVSQRFTSATLHASCRKLVPGPSPTPRTPHSHSHDNDNDTGHRRAFGPKRQAGGQAWRKGKPRARRRREERAEAELCRGRGHGHGRRDQDGGKFNSWMALLL